MADPVVASTMLPSTKDFESLAVPPLVPTIFSEDNPLPESFFSFADDGFDITFDDLSLPPDAEFFLNSDAASSNPKFLPSNLESQSFDDGVSSHGTVSDPNSLDRVLEETDVSHFFDFPSPNSGEFSKDLSNELGKQCLNVSRVFYHPSPEAGFYDPDSSQGSENQNQGSSQGSGNCEADRTEAVNCPSPDSGNSTNNSINEFVDQKIKVEGGSPSHCLLKKRKEDDVSKLESRTSKFRRSSGVENPSQNEEDEKKKARLIRNRESAQLSRQRKKHYVEELEDKVKVMHSTIQDLNAKISYVIAENTSIRQQLASTGSVCPPPVMYPHPPMAPMAYPWMPCPPYIVNPNGSQVVPIPKLKPQQPTSAPKTKKVESKKTEGKSKKVASVSFLGLLFFIMLFGVLAPMVNVRYGGIRDTYFGGSNFIGNSFYDKHRERVLMVNDNVNGTRHNLGAEFSTDNLNRPRGHFGVRESNGKQNERGNYSEHLVASLYVPRNDKLIKIDGNLIIHSVLASEKAMASHQEMGKGSNEETGLAVARNLAPAIPRLGMNNGRHPQMRALVSEKENLQSTDGKLKQWFREGLAGPMLSSGMCTEVFQFDVSTAIVPAKPVSNYATKAHQNSTNPSKGRNRRILGRYPIPLPGSSDKDRNRHVGSNSVLNDSEGSGKKISVSSMVVSVLIDPREAGDGEGDGVMGKQSKSFSRIFVVVLMDSVKYVTYSCMLPFKGSNHLVTP